MSTIIKYNSKVYNILNNKIIYYNICKIALKIIKSINSIQFVKYINKI